MIKKPLLLATALALAGIFANGNVLAQACPAGQSLDAKRGACIAAPAGATGVCPQGQVADGVGGCISTTIAFPPVGATGVCPQGQVADGVGGCMSTTIAFPPVGSPGNCPAGQVANGVGGCTMSISRAAVCTCPPGLMFSAKTGTCVNPPAGATGMCPASQVADGFGACMTPRR